MDAVSSATILVPSCLLSSSSNPSLTNSASCSEHHRRISHENALLLSPIVKKYTLALDTVVALGGTSLYFSICNPLSLSNSAKTFFLNINHVCHGSFHIYAD
ncbi:hypothetical protein BT96DRAFT_519314 [Gymnopus androsaceus JB14]|uniref:Uncharacterized protein n=1 Tax=Gymnopus androsaceus JB14 TaxID=1447944 RepID=A0A6A4GLT8_9AGAR|nr:hypothetical protein BT96DRAFT_519314 [Gymnopus androsaceus JB14]